MAAAQGEANVNPALPTGTNGDVSSRAATAAAVAWQPPSTAETHAVLVTPDISPVVREIIAMPGWAAGNSMGILFGHVAGDGSRWVESARENNGIMTPQLVIQPGVVSCDATSGI